MDEKYILRGPKPHAPVTEESLGMQLYESLIQNKNLQNALTDVTTKENVSYKTILDKSCRLAQSMQKSGITQNNVVGIFSENSLDFFYPVIAALYLGSTVTTFNSQYTPGELLHAANISKPIIIFCSEMTIDTLLEVKTHMKYLKKIVLMETDEKYNECELLDEYITLDGHLDVISFKPVPVNTEEHPAFILYSSGTTGLPKGVMITHKNLNTTLEMSRDPRYSEQYKPGTTTVMGLLPFFHAYGLCVGLMCLLHGRRVIIMKSFDPQQFLEVIQTYKMKTVNLVPPLANFLAKSPLVDEYDLSSIDTINCGAAPLSKHTQDVLKKRLNVKLVRQAYGMTETTLGVLGFFQGDNKAGSCGKVLPNMLGKIINPDTGKALGPLQEGELCFKGDVIMKGYVGDTIATKETIDQQGWLHTGDVGYYDEDGCFYVVDRLKELIKYKGFQVPPAELEAILLTHPKIFDAGVVGLPDERAGELPIAFVVTQPDVTVTEEEIKDFVAGQVSPQKHLRGGVRFVDEIPKNPSGKILRRVLRDILKQKSKL